MPAIGFVFGMLVAIVPEVLVVPLIVLVLDTDYHVIIWLQVVPPSVDLYKNSPLLDMSSEYPSVLLFHTLNRIPFVMVKNSTLTVLMNVNLDTDYYVHDLLTVSVPPLLTVIYMIDALLNLMSLCDPSLMENAICSVSPLFHELRLTSDTMPVIVSLDTDYHDIDFIVVHVSLTIFWNTSFELVAASLYKLPSEKMPSMLKVPVLPFAVVTLDVMRIPVTPEKDTDYCTHTTCTSTEIPSAAAVPVFALRTYIRVLLESR